MNLAQFCNLLFFFQNLHYSYIQEHLTPSTSICIFPCFFMIYQSCNIYIFTKSALMIHPRAPNTIHFHFYISMFLHGLSILQYIYLLNPLLIHPRAPNTIHFHLYIPMFLHDLLILQYIYLLNPHY